MTAEPHAPHIGLVVEGHGDVPAVPCLLRRWLHYRQEFRDILGRPVSCNGRANAIRPSGVEGKVAAAAARPGCRGVLVVLDGEGDLVCVLGPELARRARSVTGRPVEVALADPNFEAWLFASAETLGLSRLEYSPDAHGASAIRDALHPAKYVKRTWQVRLAARMDFGIALDRDESLGRMLNKFDALRQRI